MCNHDGRINGLFVWMSKLRGGDGSFDPFASTALVFVVFWVVAALWWWDAPLRLTIFVKRHILGDKKAPRLPPGGMGFPFVGEIPFILLTRNPDKLGAYRANKAKLGEIYCGSSPLAMHSITLCSHEAVKWGLSMENRGLEGCWPESTQTLLGKNSLSVLTGKAHKRMRSALIPVFQPQHLRQYVECMNEIVRNHLAKEWTPVKGSAMTKRICARDEMKALTFQIIADLVLGLDLEKERDTVEELNQLFDVWLKGLFMPTIKVPGSPYVAALKAQEQIKTILMKVIQRRRQDSTVTREKRDVIDILMAPTKDDAGQEILLDNDEIFDTLVNLLFAGSDTSTCSMTWVLKFLCDNPNVLDRLRKEHLEIRRQAQKDDATAETHIDWDEIDSLRYTNQVIFEVLRMHPPVAGSFRKVKQDLAYNGYLIPKGYIVAFDFQSMTQDPKYHGSSALFNPDRFESDTAIGGLSHPGFQPFGGGARMCIGYRLAIAEMNVFIHHMVLDYEWTPSPNSQDEVTYFPLPMQVDGVPLDVKRRDCDNLLL